MTRTGSRCEHWPVAVVHEGGRDESEDPVVVEEPLEIRLHRAAGGDAVPITVTLRTPGDDVELAAGLLYAEGIVARAADLVEIRPVEDPARPQDNRIDVRLAAGVAFEPERTIRHFMATAACGLCGKAAIDAVFAGGFPPIPPAGASGLSIERRVLATLAERMRGGQTVFAQTGGLHAAALFDGDGSLLALREDVGRHNAVDKVVGGLLLEGRLPASRSVLVVSGRAGFEVVQKAARAGIPVLAAVGAPSSLSLRLAARCGMTLVGFLRSERFNIYTGAERIA
jgi:FdhD protein